MTMWVKISTAGTSVFCSACIAVAAALPAIDTAADHLAKSTSAGVQLSALSNLASLSAVPAYANFLQTGDVHALTPLASLSAVPAYADLVTGDSAAKAAALSNLASLSAVPAYADLVTGDSAAKAAALSNLASLSAVPAYAA